MAVRVAAKLMTVPDIGPLIASAMVLRSATELPLPEGATSAAWLGLVPKQMSTGDRTILGRITKRGNRYLRMLFMQGARVILLRPADSDEVARAFRDDAAHGFRHDVAQGVCLAGC